MAASGQRIASECGVYARLGDQECVGPFGSTFQVADMSRALCSVGKIGNGGAKVVFDKDEGHAIRWNTAIAIFKRQGGPYTLP